MKLHLPPPAWTVMLLVMLLCAPVTSRAGDDAEAVLTQKIRECNLVLGIVGKDANKLHSDSAKIGEINWQNWEIAQAVEEGKKIILVKIKKANKIFETARGKNTYIITGFTEEKIMKALNEITEGRNMDYWAGALLGAAGLAYLYNEYTKKNS